jgi:type IV pilus assembly protein PilE
MRGYSLLELLVTLTIAGLLAALALPGYTRAMNRALRQDARISLLRLQHQEEIHFASHLSYGPQTTSSAAEPEIPARSEQGHYVLELRVARDGMSYTALARADPAGRQASDTHCALFAIDEVGRRQSADAQGNWREDDPYRCWG